MLSFFSHSSFRYFLLLPTCLLGVGWVGISQLFAQTSLDFQHYSVEDGLSQSTVFAITQDVEGFLWVGTRHGLNRFDAYEFQSFYSQAGQQDGLLNDDIRSLRFDSLRNCLWVGTIRGLSTFDPLTQRFSSVDSSASPLSYLRINAILVDHAHTVWIGTEDGLYSIAPHQSDFSIVPGSQGVSVYCLYQDQGQQLWAGTNQGLFHLETELSGASPLVKVSHHRREASPENQKIKALVEDQLGQLWVGTWEGLFVLSPSRKPIQAFSHLPQSTAGISNNQIQALEVDEQGRVWVGSIWGLNIYQADKGKFLRLFHSEESKGLQDNSIHHLYRDAKGSMWIGTYSGGVNYWDPLLSRFKNYRHHPYRNSISGNSVGPFWEDENGNLWIGTSGSGLNFWDRSQATFDSYQSILGKSAEFSASHIKCIQESGPDHLWLGTYNQGLLKWNTRTRQVDTLLQMGANGLNNSHVNAVKQSGDLLWLGTYGGGLNRVWRGKGRIDHFQHDGAQPYSLSSDLIRGVQLDRNGGLWVLTENGLNRLKSGFREPELEFEHFLSGYNLYWMHEAEDGSFWLGTYGQGLLHWHPESGLVRNLRMADGLPGDIVFGVLADQANNLWLSTNHGLALYKPTTGKLTTYGSADGLINHEYNYNSAFLSQSGEMFFGGGRGFSSFFPHQLTGNSFVPPIAFTDFTLNHQQVHPNAEEGPLSRDINHTKVITLAHNEANFSIGFSALNFLSPQHNQYAYRLDGLEEQWQNQKGKGRATYTIQKAGTYTFRVRAGNNDGLWNPSERSITIVVLPPIWKSWWALLLYGIGISATLLLLVRFNSIRHRLALEQLEKEQQAELHQAKLAFFTNIAHEFRTPLSLILSPLEELLQRQQADSWMAARLRIMERNARQLYNLINQLLVFRKIEADHLQLQEREGDLVRLAREALFAFEAKAEQCQLSLHFFPQYPRLQVLFDPDKLEKVLVNLLSNAVKFTPDGGSVEVHLFQDEEDIVIQVIDSGIGIAPEKQARIFERFYEGGLASPSAVPGSGIGLAISKKLIELHQGSLSVVSEVGKGSTFEIRLPLSRAIDQDDPEIQAEFPEASHFFYPTPPSASSAEAEEEAYPVQGGQLPKVLIVEDHTELRQYLRDLLKKEHLILEAESGEQGWAMAKEHLPDLILSDVMMDQMDGIQLCRQIKEDLQTSHIPVLLLTAKTAQEYKNMGLSSGADDYVTKPFHPSELSLRLRNLIRSRQQLRERFVRVLSLEPKEITVTSADEDFLNQVILLTEQHIDDPSFRIERFAEGLGVSRSLLFSKLKALTGQTPNNFLQHIRLKRGLQLLQSGELNVSEVAYQVGFRDPKYFSKCFSKQFGQKPSEVRKALGK